MSTTETEKPGFKIKGVFYPHVGFDDWMLPDCRLVKAITGYSESEIVTGKASPLMVNIGFAAVAFRQANPQVPVADAAAFIDTIRPEDIVFVGASLLPKDTDRRPPETSGSAPSESSEPSSDAIPDTSPTTPPDSGDQPSDTSSTSDQPT